MRAPILAIATCILVAVSSTGVSAEEHQSTPKDFEDFVETFRGRWVGDVTWASDNLGKRGESVTAYFEGGPVNNGKTYQGKFFGGEGRGTWTVFYNAGAKQIQATWLNSAGLVSHDVLYRKGGKWIEEGDGSDANGARRVIRQTVTITEGGDVHTWTGKLTIGGEEGDPIHDVWRRVSK